ncbi:MAG: mechanosensitive ion channel family protein [Flavobacteriales bacterium]|nr:mechanosensitive ion channel family protein [Flavobacteriales bacterium]
MKDHLNLTITEHWMSDLLLRLGVPDGLVSWAALGVDILILVLFAMLADLIAKRVVLRAIHKAVSKTETDLDDVLFEKRVFDALVHIAPALVVQAGAPIVFADFPEFIPWISKVVYVYMIVSVVWFMSSLLNALHEFALRSPFFRDKPMQSYVQVGKIITYIVAGVLIFSVLFDRSPLVVLSAFGAVAAVLLFVFKDTILGLVASVQISANDMLRVGDCVTMDKYAADGEVIKITLNTITIQNYDKTISHVPSYVFVSDSFKNWRGMAESGGRRIKRALLVNVSTVRFCDQEMLERFTKFQLLADHIDSRSKEIAQYNEDSKADKTYPINGRHLTNLGVFRKYIEQYLLNNPNIRKDMSLVVRQLNPTEHGIPLEIYCFANTTVMADYENIQSDMFDHLLASVSLFDLQIYQRPSGYDFRPVVV